MKNPERVDRYTLSHGGTQPIRVLQHNLVSQLENTFPGFLNNTFQAIALKGLDRGIEYHLSESPIIDSQNGVEQTPHVKDVNERKKIVIHETYLSYLWCICYSLFVIWEEKMAKPSENKILGKGHIIDDGKLNAAKKLLEYGISLIDRYTQWNKEILPNPEHYEKDDQLNIEKANGLFVHAMQFILLHEFIHIESQHIHKLIESEELEEKDILVFELEADQKAIEYLLKGLTEEKRISAYIGIALGICSLFYFSEYSYGGPTHPDIEQRLDAFLGTINPDNNDPIWGIICLAIQVWANKFKKRLPTPNSPASSYKDSYLKVRDYLAEENNCIRKGMES